MYFTNNLIESQSKILKKFIFGRNDKKTTNSCAKCTTHKEKGQPKLVALWGLLRSAGIFCDLMEVQIEILKRASLLLITSC